MFTEGREDAYKNLPIDPDDMSTAIAALRHPTTHRRRGFVARTLISGPIDAVINYNVTSRVPAAQACRCLGLPTGAYFGDFSEIIRKKLSDAALKAFARFCPPPVGDPPGTGGIPPLVVGHLHRPSRRIPLKAGWK